MEYKDRKQRPIAFLSKSLNIPEIKMGKADGLSKKLNQKVDIKKDNENQKLIKEEQIYNLAEVVVKGPKIDILSKY